MNDDTDAIIDEMACHCVAARLRVLNRVVSGIYNDALRPHGAQVGQMNIMIVTEKFGAPTPSDICRVLRMDRSTVSRNVDRMKKNGWLKTVPAKDGRSYTLRVTVRGKQKIAAVHPAWRDAQERVKNLLGDAAHEAIFSLGNRAMLGGAGND